MYGGWRSREDNKRRSKCYRPPKPLGPAYHEVPLWEKDFCSKVCRVPWGKICDVKKFLAATPHITNWDDSSSRAAFENAKSRYWAEINLLKCDIPPPDPDIYIDEVDFYDNFVSDPKLYDEVGPKPPLATDEDEPEPIKRDPFNYEDMPVVEDGWGDDEGEEKPEEYSTFGWGPRPPIKYVGWDDDENGNTVEQQLPIKNDAEDSNAPEQHPATVTTRWGDAEDCNTANEKLSVQATGCGNAEFNHEINADSGHAWTQNASCGAWGDEAVQNDSCGNGGNRSNSSWNNGRNSAWNNGRDNKSLNYGRSKSWVPSNNRSDQQWRRNGNGGNFGSNFFRFGDEANNYQTNNYYGNHGREMINAGAGNHYEKTTMQAGPPVCSKLWKPKGSSGQ